MRFIVALDVFMHTSIAVIQNRSGHSMALGFQDVMETILLSQPWQILISLKYNPYVNITLVHSHHIETNENNFSIFITLLVTWVYVGWRWCYCLKIHCPATGWTKRTEHQARPACLQNPALGRACRGWGMVLCAWRKFCEGPSALWKRASHREGGLSQRCHQTNTHQGSASWDSSDISCPSLPCVD